MAKGELTVSGSVVQFPQIGGNGGEAVKQPVSKVFAPKVIEFYYDMGVPDPFLAMMTRYFGDTRVGVSTESDVTTHTVSRTANSGGELSWERRTTLSAKHIMNLTGVIEETVETMGFKVEKPEESAQVLNLKGEQQRATKQAAQRTLRTIAVNTAFFETTADALSDCFYMQHRYDHYIPDFNGQYWGSEKSVSRDFMDAYAAYESEAKHEAAIAQDHRNFRSGVGMMFLADELLRQEVVGSMTEAAWVVRAVAMNYPTERRYKTLTTPMEADEIEARCHGLYVRPNVLLSYNLFDNPLTKKK